MEVATKSIADSVGKILESSKTVKPDNSNNEALEILKTQTAVLIKLVQNLGAHKIAEAEPLDIKEEKPKAFDVNVVKRDDKGFAKKIRITQVKG